MISGIRTLLVSTPSGTGISSAGYSLVYSYVFLKSMLLVLEELALLVELRLLEAGIVLLDTSLHLVELADGEPCLAEQLVEESDPSVELSHEVPGLREVQHNDDAHALQQGGVTDQHLEDLLVLVVVHEEELEFSVGFWVRWWDTVVGVPQVGDVEVCVVDDRSEVFIAESRHLRHSCISTWLTFLSELGLGHFVQRVYERALA